MKRLGRMLAVLTLVCLPMLWATPAWADDEYISHLDVTYDIQRDGTVDVRYEVQWHFPEKDRHGIILDFATREPWDQDYSQDVLYDITDVSVSSPSGAPAGFTQTTRGAGSTEAVSLRIGDPDVELGTRDATYVVEYTMAGALRTFEGAPQLFWDVNSPDLPQVRKFTATVTGPEGVARARCLVGSEECQSAVDDGVASFSHDGGPGVTSVVAELPPGSVTRAEPVLEPKRLIGHELRGLYSTVEVLPDGSAEVQQRLEFMFPADASERIQLDFVVRAPWSEDLDQVIDISDVRIRDEQGGEVTPEVWRSDSAQSTLVGWLTFRADNPGAQQVLRTFHLSYRIAGAVAVEGDTARLRVPIVHTGTYDLTGATAVWRLPAAPEGTACLDLSYYREGPGRPCEFSAQVDGATVTAGLDLLGNEYPPLVTDFALPAAAFTSTVPLEPSLDAARNERRAAGTLLGLGGGGAVIAAGAAAALVGRRRDERYATVAPGLVGAPGVVRAVRRNEDVPVRFHPPEIQPRQAGLLLDRQFKPVHLAATLVQLAVRNLVVLDSKPLIVQRVDGSGEGASGTEWRVLLHATDSREKLPANNARQMRQIMEEAAEHEIATSGWFQPYAPTKRGLLVFFLPLLPAVLFTAYALLVDNPLPDGGFRIGLGLFIGGVAGAILGKRLLPKAILSADGTALRDQVEGFRKYINTAEAKQLNFEADRDIYRRYLPWAVVLGLTERWTAVCREWAAQGRIDEVDTSFWVGSASFADFDREMSRFSREVTSASAPPASSGGSGGSSGFSSGSSGGGGGGGTSGSSW
ncbi:DUF2207 domain-containing protein [Tessaracoccus sp. MC1865]|uniref:DUF2207 domain-containing protein n=1 Tax=Tessaracoccus sp. MC1865 TaxID=2760310 RepID=UPI001600FE28|nr:DUF2207 domain-containing protein [Tessaracoccus sp. MC1865]MBB1484224.1 DUF2207 domain-containing protein [Tessaracoccus sp. MC1865]QTO37243.1 DUF2207 domain-containing protein [Tessaracoccus sp. MC1865]